MEAGVAAPPSHGTGAAVLGHFLCPVPSPGRGEDPLASPTWRQPGSKGTNNDLCSCFNVHFAEEKFLSSPPIRQTSLSGSAALGKVFGGYQRLRSLFPPPLPPPLACLFVCFSDSLLCPRLQIHCQVAKLKTLCPPSPGPSLPPRAAKGLEICGLLGPVQPGKPQATASFLAEASSLCLEIVPEKLAFSVTSPLVTYSPRPPTRAFLKT